MRNILVLPIFLAAISLLAPGCLSLSKKYPDKFYYVIEAARSGPSPAPIKDSVLEVRSLRISPLYEGKDFVYRVSAEQLEPDYYNQFFIAPAAMITDQTRAWMAASGKFEQTADLAERSRATHIIEGAVNVLCADYSSPGAPKAVLEVQWLFFHERLGPAKLLWAKTYRKEIPIEKANPALLVRGWNQALAEALADFEKDLNALK